jgi:STE24 endopeptidase
MITSTTIFYVFILFFILVSSSKILLLFLNIHHIKGHLNAVPTKFQSIISLSEHKKAQNYTIAKNKFSIVSLLIHSIILSIWLFGGQLNSLHEYLNTLQFSDLTLGAVFLITFSIINTTLEIPQSIYSTFFLEEKFGFNKTTPKIFIIDMFKQTVLSIVIGLPLIYAVLFLLKNTGSMWWFFTWVFLVIFQFLMIWAFPKFISPLFNKFTPLEDQELIKDIQALCTRCQIVFKEYFVMDASIRSSHGNAYFTGFGKNKRIVFFDTLIKSLTYGQVISVLAHELGHFKKKHIIKSIIVGVTSMFIGLAILGYFYNKPEFFQAFSIQTESNHMALLLFMLIIPYFTYFLTPLSSWSSRKNEYEADQFAAENASAKELIGALLQMYKDNSSSLTPHPWYSNFYFSHPPAAERVRFLERFDS